MAAVSNSENGDDKLGGPQGESLVRSAVEPVSERVVFEPGQEAALAIVSVCHRRVTSPGTRSSFPPTRPVAQARGDLRCGTLVK